MSVVEQAGRYSLDYLRFTFSVLESTGLVSSPHYRAILSRDYFGEMGQIRGKRNGPTVGTIMFNKMDPIVMVIIYGVMTPIWWLFGWFTVWYRPENGNRNFTWLNIVDTLFFWGNSAIWAGVLLSFIILWISPDSAGLRFFYWIFVLISCVGGPWGGWIVAYIVWILEYAAYPTAYTASATFLHLFLFGCWELVMIFFAIDSIGPIWDWYSIKANEAPRNNYDGDRPIEQYRRDL